MVASVHMSRSTSICGTTDLVARIIRHVGGSLRVDTLRILRVGRFAASAWIGIAPETLTEIGRLSAAGVLATVAPEPVWGELKRRCGWPGSRWGKHMQGIVFQAHNDGQSCGRRHDHSARGRSCGHEPICDYRLARQILADGYVSVS